MDWAQCVCVCVWRILVCWYLVVSTLRPECLHLADGSDVVWWALGETGSGGAHLVRRTSHGDDHSLSRCTWSNVSRFSSSFQVSPQRKTLEQTPPATLTTFTWAAARAMLSWRWAAASRRSDWLIQCGSSQTRLGQLSRVRLDFNRGFNWVWREIQWKRFGLDIWWVLLMQWITGVNRSLSSWANWINLILPSVQQFTECISIQVFH